MAKKKVKTFQVTARIVMIVQKDLHCETLDEALAASKNWGTDDFITLEECGYEDASCQITGVCDFDKHYDTEQ